MGLPPKGRVGYVTRLGAALSDPPFCWPSIYVSQDKSGAGHENLHKVLAFDCLANRGLLDFGHWYLDGYSPGTPQSAGFVNRFVRAHAPRLSHRRYLADVAVVHSAWSEIASMNVFNPDHGQVRGRILRLVRFSRRHAPPVGRGASVGTNRQEPRALSRRRPAVGDDAVGRGHQRTPPLRGRRRPPRRHRRDRHALRPGALPRTARTRLLAARRGSSPTSRA